MSIIFDIKFFMWYTINEIRFKVNNNISKGQTLLNFTLNTIHKR